MKYPINRRATLFILRQRGRSNSLCPPLFTYSNKITYASFWIAIGRNFTRQRQCHEYKSIVKDTEERPTEFTAWLTLHSFYNGPLRSLYRLRSFAYSLRTEGSCLRIDAYDYFSHYGFSGLHCRVLHQVYEHLCVPVFLFILNSTMCFIQKTK